MFAVFNDLQINSQVIIRLSDFAYIPIDALNADYLEYVQWLFEGNTPEEWQPQNIEPASEPVIEETPADSTDQEPVTEDGN